MTSTEYATKLRDPRWQKRRLEIFNAHQFTCQDCGAKERELHAHHCWYNMIDAEPWDYPDECFRCLCDECHSDRHVIERSVVFQFRKLMARHDQDHLHHMHGVFYTALENNAGLSIIQNPPSITWPEWALNASAPSHPE